MEYLYDNVRTLPLCIVLLRYIRATYFRSITIQSQIVVGLIMENQLSMKVKYVPSANRTSGKRKSIGVVLITLFINGSNLDLGNLSAQTV